MRSDGPIHRLLAFREKPNAFLYPIGLSPLEFCWRNRNLDIGATRRCPAMAAGNQVTGNMARRIAVDADQKLWAVLACLLDRNVIDDLSAPGDGHRYIFEVRRFTAGVRKLRRINSELPISTQKLIIPVPRRVR